ncbi:hypothetical protein [Bartonella tamiae]|uniref:Uncharacterized protein n=1 Tax=Bartonella tamiae Th239 TaxID=1094558 RepID=J0ZPQ6_9HYPH|nr:hypothetical protein [Bartonella tamiae]EJF90578.1 hypothetical protein ME5_00979 [Bartonella tamiae Th239]EJF94044.1 hypothetical protein MEG_00902 [Bartonella tamiae Th307]
MKKMFNLKILAIISLLTVSLLGATGVLAADCAEVGKRVAEEQAGRLARSTPVVQNGQNMCVVVVIVPASNGEKPRRVEVAVPAK